jgi:hypothetical protein
MKPDGTDPMRKLRNEDGVALITALMFTLICLGIVMALMQMLLVQTKMSASQKTYRNAIEASYGGTEMLTKEFIPRLANYSTGIAPLMATFAGNGALPQMGLAVNRTLVTGGETLKVKLNTATASWPTAVSKTPDAKVLPDFNFTLKGDQGSNFNVYAKIIDTVPGNSDTTGVDFLDSGQGVAGTGSGIAPKHNPSLYTIEVQGERANAKEKAKLSVLYAY